MSEIRYTTTYHILQTKEVINVKYISSVLAPICLTMLSGLTMAAPVYADD